MSHELLYRSFAIGYKEGFNFFKIKKIHEHAAYRSNSVFWKGTAAAADVTAAAADINAAAKC